MTQRTIYAKPIFRLQEISGASTFCTSYHSFLFLPKFRLEKLGCLLKSAVKIKDKILVILLELVHGNVVMNRKWAHSTLK